MESFFKQYTAAFDAFDAKAIANLYRLPCAIADADGVQSFTDRSALVSKFAANCKSMQAMGYSGARFTVLNQQQLGPNEVAVNIGWRIELADSQIDFRTLYICHRINQCWYIFNTNVYPGSFSQTP
ncbi:hypothetical protein P2G88_11595 [Aliiglaciecola sp. CAU 1673]|uniref:hypothetical protein n=1 Tax=Aliiglaciecola sp. CAU 1673 TaxID=3032595 RepID=UPI0023DB627D|nr:hypothetical protein [Aliiglaciecola sp. CAU 1673]MDF2178893.1 hypothetical protein [Aliiglaciecola sp. CAU 1673]